MEAAFIFLSLTNPSPDYEREIDQGTFLDEEEGDIDDESDVELNGNDQLNLDLILSQIYSPLQRIELALQKNFSDPQLFQKLKNTNLLHSSPPLEFFQTFHN